MRVLLVDNYDSFTGNLAQLVAVLTGELPRVVRNDEQTVDELLAWRPERVILSPGPGSPTVARDVGVCLALIDRLGDVPLLGVCLGHQAIGVQLGARVIHAPRPMHGKSSSIELCGDDPSGVLRGLPDGFRAVRYHSLILDEESLPSSLCVTARAGGVVMAIAHRTRPIAGVQFHPESIETEHGAQLMSNFLGVRGAPPERVFSTARAIAPPARVATRTLPWIDPERAFVGLLAGEPCAFWLDNAAEGRGRFSYLGAGAGEQIAATGHRIAITSDGSTTIREGDLFAFLGQRLASRIVDRGAFPFELASGYVGYLGYELKEQCGGAPGPREAGALPDAQLMLATRVMVFDHQERTVTLVALDDAAWIDTTAERLATLPEIAPPSTGTEGEVSFERTSDADYRAAIARALEKIVDGESYEICLTTQVRAALEVDPLTLYRVLRARNPAPYAAYLRFPDCAILCSSPERFLHIGADRTVESRPIKGTRRRGSDPGADLRLAAELAASEKDRAENLMIVDLVRSDLGHIAATGSVEVPARFVVESHPTVFQLVSTVRARLRDGVAPIECVRALFPGGSMTGAPKIRSMEIIGELEGAPRGVYAGGIGFCGFDGAIDLAMAIRTIVVTPGECRFGIGGAIVADSIAGEELDEIEAKAAALKDAIRAVARATP